MRSILRQGDAQDRRAARHHLHSCVIGFLLLFSAFLTALTGAVVGSAASAQPVEASATATHASGD
jgi:hypothetical protein